MSTLTRTGSPLRTIRALAEGAIVVVAFAVAILLIGLPVALVARLVHDLVAFVW